MEVDLSDSPDTDRGELSAVLADQVRLDVLRRLQDADAPISLADLAVEFAREEVDDESDQWVRAECYRLQLDHELVPSLEAAGLVEYDSQHGTVSLAPRATKRQIDAALDVTSRT